jgi:hypothetical protein
VSLAERRRQKLAKAVQTNKPLEQRCAELEADLLRVIDQLLDVTERLEQSERLTRKLLGILRNEFGDRGSPPSASDSSSK